VISLFRNAFSAFSVVMSKVLPEPKNPTAPPQGQLVVVPQASAVDVASAADGSSKALTAGVDVGAKASAAAGGAATAATAAAVSTTAMAAGATALVAALVVVVVVATGGGGGGGAAADSAGGTTATLGGGPPPTPTPPAPTPAPPPGFWAGCSNHAEAALAAAQPAGYPRSVAALGAANPTTLPRSLPGLLLTLRRIAGSSGGACASAVVARSYDGHPWEGVQPAPVQPVCSAATGDCTLAVPAAASFNCPAPPAQPCSFRVDAAVRGAVQGGADALVARLLTQATFGPTRASLAAYKSAHSGGGGAGGATAAAAAAAAWVQSQMSLPPTSLREYYRARANPRITSPTQAGGVVGACEVGSRWHRFAFTARDRFETVTATQERAGTLSLRVNGVLRTEVTGTWCGITAAAAMPPAPAPAASCTLCKVPDYLYNATVHFQSWWPTSGRVHLSTTVGACSGAGYSPIVIPNPPLLFSAVDAATTYEFGGGGGGGGGGGMVAAFRGLRAHGVTGGVLVMTALADPAACRARAPPHASPLFMTWGGATYKHDPRLKLLGNTVAAPAQQTLGAGNVLSAMDPSRGTATTCPNVRRTFANRAGCARRPTCAPLRFSAADVVLTAGSVRLWYSLSGRHVHKITGLRLDGAYAVSPCKAGSTSRWLKIGGGGACAAPTASSATTATLAAAIAASSDTGNAALRDVVDAKTLGGGGACSGHVGAIVDVAGGGCWQHVHPHTHNVYDLSYWVGKHDGNVLVAKVSGANPIRKAAEAGLVDFAFPVSHSADRWSSRVKYFPLLGRFGDTVKFSALPTDAQTPAMAAHFGAILSPAGDAAGDDLAEACGSPFEVPNAPALGNHYPFMVEDRAKQVSGQDYDTSVKQHEEELDFPAHSDNTKAMAWTNVMLTAPDQLRQRMAWALQQHLVVGVPGLARKKEHGCFFAYHDIMARHAHGSYGALLKEVAFAPIMGEYLTHKENKAQAYSGSYPDENFAREVMQLFTIGLWQLNPDGTRKTTTAADQQGAPIPTYSNEDITAFARVWTGFDFQPSRANMEAKEGLSSHNSVDTMQIKPAWHDRLPKTKLDGGYLGDRYPLCHALPPRHFLRAGAAYVLTGAASMEGEYFDKQGFAQDGSHGRFRPDPAPGVSALHAALCARPAAAAGSNSNCTFPSAVTLASALACHGIECEVDAVRSVKVYDPTSRLTRWYRYRAPPCARLTFAQESRYTSMKQINQRSFHQCADTAAPVAGVMCCDGADTVDSNGRSNINPVASPTGPSASRHCLHANEKVRFGTAASRCAAAGKKLCHQDYRWGAPATRSSDDKATEMAAARCANGAYVWTDTPCSITLQVHEDGLVNLVDTPPADQWAWTSSGWGGAGAFPELRNNSKHTFRVRWSADGKSDATTWPTYAAAGGGCAAAGCVPGVGAPVPTCRCAAAASTAVVFSNSEAQGVPTAAQVEGGLFIGALAPGAYGAAAYKACASAACVAAAARAPGDAVRVHLKQTAGAGAATTLAALDADSIFEVTRFGRTVFLLNARSTVTVGGGAGAKTIRNPPHMLPLLGERFGQWGDQFLHEQDSVAADGAMDEIDALIEHLFEHENTPPFVATRLIQRFTSSNPSPRYVKAVADAFRSGHYTPAGSSGGGGGGGGPSFGGGKYGDLGAAAAAIVLDREARSATLDADPSAGKLREPLLKVLHLLRAMEYTPKEGREVAADDMADKVGMGFMAQPSVFNFYLPEYRPAGPVGEASLVAPEAQLATAPNLVGYLNGVHSLVEYGLTSCFRGFGSSMAVPKRGCGGWAPSYDTADGALAWAPRPGTANDAAAVVDELALLLTDGRLSASSRATLVAAYNDTLHGSAASSSLTPPKRPAGLLPAASALKAVQKLAAAAPEFHATNVHANPTGAMRAAPAAVAGSGKPFKAVLVLFLHGGIDSFNMLVPHSGCTDKASGGAAKDLYVCSLATSILSRSSTYSLTHLLPLHLFPLAPLLFRCNTPGTLSTPPCAPPPRCRRARCCRWTWAPAATSRSRAPSSGCTRAWAPSVTCTSPASWQPSPTWARSWSPSPRRSSSASPSACRRRSSRTTCSSASRRTCTRRTSTRRACSAAPWRR
jgi:cullin-associated NEDD8-dissociated protein 1